MGMLDNYLKMSIENGASDIFIVAGKALTMKIAGKLEAVGDKRLMPDDTLLYIKELYSLAKREFVTDDDDRDDDFSITIPDLGRFRVNVFWQRGSIGSVIRVVRFGIPDAKKMGIPDEVMRLKDLKHGLVLVTGAAGSGKSTTLACIVDAINKTRSVHIITIEDPIEYLHRNAESIVTQRELSKDTESYATALRASLRQAPDVILLGEMRDLGTIQAAMTAAETGHLVLSTLHTVGAPNAIDRIIDVFPPDQQQQIRIQLSQVLRSVVSQQLLRSVDGGRVPAFEIMNLNHAIRTMIRDSRIHQLDFAIQTGASEGMISMDDSILKLYKAGRISKDTAIDYAMAPEQLQRKL